SARRHQYLVAPRMTVAVRILAWLIHVERMVRMFDQRHGEAALRKYGNEFLDQSRLAGSRIARYAEYFHRLAFYQPAASIVGFNVPAMNVQAIQDRQPDDL